MKTTDLRRVVDIVITGSRDDITALITAATAAGRLVHATAPQPVSVADPRLRSRIRIHNPDQH